MLYGYFDESGQQTNGWVCLAGFIGSRVQWQEFDARWKAARGRKARLHMHDLRWANPRTRRLLERLGPVPYACGLEPARAVVRVSDYADLVAGTRDEVLYKGYTACLGPLVADLVRAIPADEALFAVFERQDRHERQAGHMLRVHRPRLAGWQFLPKGASARLEPADYLAFAVRSLHEAPSSQKTQWCMPILGPGGTSQVAIGGTLSREQVRRIVSRTLAMNRAQGLG